MASFLGIGFRNKSLRLITFSWIVCFWSFFHFACDVSRDLSDVDIHVKRTIEVRATACFFIFTTSFFVFIFAVFSTASSFKYCNLINGLLLLTGGFLYFVACFVNMNESDALNDNGGYQLLGHYMQPAILAMLLGWDSVQIHYEYVKFKLYTVRIGLYSLIIAISHFILIVYWYNLDQTQLNNNQKAYEAGQFFLFFSATLIFVLVSVLNCNQWENFKIFNIILSLLLLLGAVIILISGYSLYVFCDQCTNFWCIGHSVGYYFLVFVLCISIIVDMNSDKPELK